MRQRYLALWIGVIVYPCAVVHAVDVPWPAEPMISAQNLTSVEGPGVNDFHSDLSGAFWNPVRRRLWVCRNGPLASQSKIWAIREDGMGGFVCDYRNSLRGEWTGFGDIEDLTQANLNEDSIYVIVEGEERIKKYDVSVYGVAVLLGTWDLSQYLPIVGDSGAEGIAFVPDENLISGGFVDSLGNPRLSQGGMGGLMFVAHQNGGRIYVFDLMVGLSEFRYVGSYQTGFTESCALAFDRNSGMLHIFHGAGFNRLEVASLQSSVVGPERKLQEIMSFAPPSGITNSNIEGIAVVSDMDCAGDHRSLFMAIDDGGPWSLVRFRNYPCSVSADLNGDGLVDGRDIDEFASAAISQSIPWVDFGFAPGDMNLDGSVDNADVAMFCSRLISQAPSN